MPAQVDAEKCDGCKTCLESCPNESIKMADDKAVVDRDSCIDCEVCMSNCPQSAISME